MTDPTEEVDGVEEITQLLSRIDDFFKTPASTNLTALNDPALQEAAFNPLPKILEIVQSKNPEKKQRQLEEDCELMDIAMQMIVNAYYNGFNKSIASYSHILRHITQSKQSVKALKEQLQESKAKLQVRVEDLHQLWLKNLECIETLHILNDVEEVRRAPEQLDNYVKTKDWQRASTLLVSSLSILDREDIRNIGALYDVKLAILEWNQRFHKQLTEELIHRIYHSKRPNETLHNSIVTPPTTLPTSRDPIQYLSLVRYTLSPQEKEDVKVLVDAVLTIGRHREVKQALHASIGPEMMAIVASTIALIKERYTPQEKEKYKHPDSSVSENSALVEFLHRLFERSISILFHHHYLCELFQNSKNELRPSRRKRATLTSSRTPELEEDDVEYVIGSVWESMQAKLVGLLKLYLLTPVDADSLPQSVPFSTASYPSKRKLFRFADSSAATFSENVGSVAQDAVSASLGLFRASPHNVAIVYPIVQIFQQEVTEGILVSEPAIDPQYRQLQSYLDDFVQNHFLPHIQHDYQCRLATSVDGTEAFKIHDRKRHHGEYKPEFDARPLFQSSVEVAGYVEELVGWMAGMEKYAPHFMQTVEMIVLHYISKCSSKYTEITTGTHTASLISLPETVLAMKADAQWQMSLEGLPQSNNKQSIKAVEEAITQGIFEHEQALFAPGAIQRARLVVDVNKLQTLANMCDSLEWLAQRITSLSRQLGLSEASVNKLTPMAEKNSDNAEHKGGDSFKSSLQTIITSISGDVLALGTRFSNLSDCCLLALKCELRLHCFYFLDSIRHCSYVLTEERAEPDIFVAELNKDLSSVKDMLSVNLPARKVQYLFAGMDRLISTIIIDSLAKIQDINKAGVLKMCRNLFALQQNLSTLMIFKEAHFDKARRYYKLLNQTEEELRVLLTETQGDDFTHYQYKVLLKHKRRASKKLRPSKQK